MNVHVEHVRIVWVRKRMCVVCVVHVRHTKDLSKAFGCCWWSHLPTVALGLHTTQVLDINSIHTEHIHIQINLPVTEGKKILIRMKKDEVTCADNCSPTPSTSG